MKKLVVILLLLTFFTGCNKDNSNANKEIEFYLLESYQLVTGRCEVEKSTAILQSQPFVSNDEILEYRKNKFEYRLSKSAIQKINALQPRAPFAVTINKKIVFLGIYMPLIMSSSCVHSITMFALDNTAYMQLGYPGTIQTPSGTAIDDQRNNSSLLVALKSQGKLR